MGFTSLNGLSEFGIFPHLLEIGFVIQNFSSKVKYDNFNRKSFDIISASINILFGFCIFPFALLIFKFPGRRV